MATYSGTGVSLSSTFFMRNYYTANRDAATSSKRSNYSNSSLSNADAVALRRAVKKLSSYEYNESEDTNVRSSVQAFINTYNNLISSGTDTGDRTVERALKSMKSLTSEYENKLDEIGITIKSDGTLESRSSLFSSADISKFKKLFSSDSEYMQKASSYAKRIERRSSALIKTEQMEASLAKKSSSADTANSSTEAAQIAAASLALDTASTNGIGTNINLYL